MARGDAGTAESTIRRAGNRWTTPTDIAKAIHATERNRYRNRYENLKERDREDLLNRARAAIKSLSGLEQRGRDNYRMGKGR